MPLGIRLRREHVQPMPPQLGALFDRLNGAYFHGLCQAQIGWGRRTSPRRRSRRGMLLGSWSPSENRIRIHPALAADWVPLFVVEMVVFHEMLHEVFGCPQRGARRVVHPPEFQAVEQSHPDYARAQAWEQANLPRLLRSRSG